MRDLLRRLLALLHVRRSAAQYPAIIQTPEAIKERIEAWQRYLARPNRKDERLIVGRPDPFCDCGTKPRHWRIDCQRVEGV